MNSISVKLADGSTIEVDDEKWQTICSPVVGNMVDGGVYQTERLIVCRHSDGRYIVYAEIQVGQDPAIAVGQVVPGDGNVEDAVLRVACENGLKEFHVEGCLQQLRAK